MVEELCKKYPCFTEEEISEAYRLLNGGIEITDIVCSVAGNSGKKPIEIAPLAFETHINPEAVMVGEWIARKHGVMGGSDEGA